MGIRIKKGRVNIEATRLDSSLRLPSILSTWILPLLWSLLIAFLIFSSRQLHLSNFSIENGDNFQVVFPFFAHFIDSIKNSGSFDPWNPWIWGGTPGIGNPNVPMNFILYTFLHLDRAGFIIAMNWHVFAEVLLAALGMFFLLRKTLNKEPLAYAGAALYVLSTSMTITIAFYSTFFHFTIIPWVLLVLLKIQNKTGITEFSLLCLLFYLQFTYGQLQMTLYSIYFYFLAVFWFLREQLHPKKSAITLFLALGFSGFLAAHFILPMADVLKSFNDRSSFRIDEFTAASRVRWQYLSSLFVPGLFWSKAGWWPLHRDGWSLWESFMCHSGILLSFLWLFSLKDLFKKVTHPLKVLQKRFFVFSMVLIGLNMTSIGGMFILSLTGMSMMPFARTTHFILFSLLICGLVNLYFVFKDRRELFRFSLFAALGACALLVFQSDLVLRPFLLSLFDSAYQLTGSLSLAPEQASLFWTAKNGFLKSEVLIQTVVLAASALFCLLALFFTQARFRFVALAFALLISAYSAYDFQQVRMIAISDKYPFEASLQKDNPVIDYLEENMNPAQENFFWLTNTRETLTGLSPNQNGLARLSSVNGYTSIYPRKNSYEPKIRRGNYGNHVFSENLLKLRNVKYVVMTKNSTHTPEYYNQFPVVAENPDLVLRRYPGFNPKFFVPDSFTAMDKAEDFKEVFKSEEINPQQHSFVATSRPSDLNSGCTAKVRSVQTENSNVSIKIKNPCATDKLFVSSIGDFRWWKFFVDGEPIVPLVANGLHRALFIPPGEHQIELKVESASLKLGLWVSFGALLVLLSLVVLSLTQLGARLRF